MDDNVKPVVCPCGNTHLVVGLGEFDGVYAKCPSCGYEEYLTDYSELPWHETKWKVNEEA